MATYAPAGVRTGSPTYQAYQLLHIAFVVAPIVAGVDKFFHVLVNWDQYLSPIVPHLLGVSAHSFMLGVGVIEVIAGLIVGVLPSVGAWIVGVWLCGIVVNLLSIPGYLDIALRDVGLALAAFALARLAREYPPA
ncbi:MAG TPA: hypothetical protein VL309_08865 [Vicinamibacterales bacterium]|jgi:hypothetical protein|nr:hypothetical protein [Vicinamibacterales bacterium]